MSRQQAEDKIVFEGKEGSLKPFPLGQYLKGKEDTKEGFEKLLIESNCIKQSTNSRGYTCDWLIEDGMLYLTSINCMQTSQSNNQDDLAELSEEDASDPLIVAAYKMNKMRPIVNNLLAQVFNSEDVKIVALWFSGELRIGLDGIWHWVAHNKSKYKREVILTIENGKVVKSDTINNIELFAYKDSPWGKYIEE